MDRRSLLVAVGVATGLSGCLDRVGIGDDDASDDGTPTETPTEGATGTPTEPGEQTDTPDEEDGTSDDETPTPTPGGTRMTGTEFEVTDERGGGDCDDSEYESEIHDDHVTVDGWISGRNGCYTAELSDATYDADADELQVTIRSFDDSDEMEGCTQECIEIEYESRYDFEGGVPEEVSVDNVID